MDILDDITKRVQNLSIEKQKELLEILTGWQEGKQREYQRLSMPMGIDILIGDKLIKTNMENISASGVLIKTSEKVDVKKEVRVVFIVPGAEKPFKLEGKVVRSGPDGLAVEFSSITPYFKKILDDTIWRDRDRLDEDNS